MGAAAVDAALALLAAPTAALAQQFPGILTVDTTADGNDGECGNDCTLREAVSPATPGQTASIMLPPGVYRLTNGPLVLTSNILAKDRCNGKLTRVTDGRVAVRDFIRKRTVIVRAGRHYLAKRRR